MPISVDSAACCPQKDLQQFQSVQWLLLLHLRTSQILLSDIRSTVPKFHYVLFVCFLSVLIVFALFESVVGLEAGAGGLGRGRWSVSFTFGLRPVFPGNSKVDIPY